MAAFTLLEIMLTVVILSIVLSLTLPNLARTYNHVQLQQTANDIQNKARWAQAMAMERRRVYALSFGQDRRSYSLMQAELDTNGQAAKLEALPGTIGRTVQVPDTVALASDTDSVLFFPDATIAPVEIGLSSAGRKITLSSEQVRGMLTASEE